MIAAHSYACHLIYLSKHMCGNSYLRETMKNIFLMQVSQIECGTKKWQTSFAGRHMAETNI